MKRSKILSFLLAIMMIVSTMSCLAVISGASVIAEDGEYDEEGNLVEAHWQLEGDGTLTIFCDTEPTWTAYRSQITKIVLDAKVTEIPNSSFVGCDKLTEINFTTGLAKIEAGAFQNLDSLQTVQIAAVTTIEDYAFYDCDSLTEVYIGGGLAQEAVGENVFKSCDNLTFVWLGNGSRAIGYGMFEDCANLITAEIPDSIVTIGAHAFDGCASLTAVTIPDSTESVGAYAFYDCSSVKSVSIGHKAENFGEFIFGNNTSLETVTIASAMPVVSNGMFYGCTSLKSMSALPQGVQTIGYSAFMGCTALESIDIPATTTMIGESAFDGTALKEVTIPWNVVDIGNGAFTNCADLAAINVDAKNANYASVDGVLYDISLDLLLCCPAGKTGTYTINKGTTTIANGAFIGCDKLTTVEAPDSIDNVANNAFNGCSADLVIVTGCTTALAELAEKRGITTDLVHSTVTKWVETSAPTCEADGEKANVCADCDHVFTTEVVPALGHEYDNGVVTKKATCEVDGEMTYTCANCGDAYTEVIPAIGHNYVEAVTKPATCIDAGKKTHTCSNCGDAYETTFAGEHRIATATVNPTCDAAGKTGEWCVICNQFVGAVTELPATGHSYKDGKCTKCGKTNGTSGNTTPTPTPVVRPATPKMKLIRNEVKGLSVTWTAVDGAASYRVYRRGAGERYWTYLTTVSTNSYLDTKAETGKYWRYTVRAVGKTGLYSGYENGIYIKRVDTPAMKKLTNTKNGINVTWSEVSNAKEYRVYRRGAGERTWTYIATVTSTSYLDTAVKNANGQYFRYTVRAVDGYYSNFESGIYTKRVSK